MAHRLTTAATAAVLTANEAREHVRFDLGTDDILLNSLIARATRHCEHITKRQFLSATWTLSMDSFCDRRYMTNNVIYVPRPPLLAVSSIAYLDSDGDSTTLDAADYRVDAQNQPGRIEVAYGEVWPVTRNVVNAVTITHTAGYGTAATSVPDDIKHAILLLAGHWYQNREAVLVGSISKELEFSVMSILDPYIMEQYA